MPALLDILPRGLYHQGHRDRHGLLQGLRHLCRGVPAQGHRHGERDEMKMVDIANHVAAHAVKLSRVEVVSAYPITPPDPGHRGDSRPDRSGGNGQRVYPGGERAQRHGRPHRVRRHGGALLFRHLLARPGLYARAAALGGGNPPAHGDGERESGHGAGLEHMVRPPGLHQPARHRLDPALLRLAPGDRRHRHPGLPHQRGRPGDPAGDGQLRRLRPLPLLHAGRPARPELVDRFLPPFNTAWKLDLENLSPTARSSIRAITKRCASPCSRGT